MALAIHLDLNATTILAGQTISINISEYNDLPTSINVTSSGDWRLSGLALDPCGTLFYPFGIAVFQGHYSSDNISNAKSLNLFPANFFCAKTIFSNEWFMFQPLSDYASTSQSSSPIPIRSSISLNGTWTGANSKIGLNFSNFSPGTYTVAVGDEWGHLIIANFQLVNGT